MEKQSDKVAAILRKELPGLKLQYNVATLELFGSFVKDEQTPASDLDLLVSFSKAPSLFKFLELEQFLSGILGLQVDLVMKSALKPHIGQIILSEAQSIQ